jgi:hypothetical protein
MDNAAVLIGNLPVGPKCAKQAGLIKLSKRKSGLVFPVAQSRRAKQDQTMDLFEGLENE